MSEPNLKYLLFLGPNWAWQVHVLKASFLFGTKLTQKGDRCFQF